MAVGYSKRRAVVQVSDRNKRGCELWGYGYADLAEWLGISQGAVRQRVNKGKLDPSDILGVCRAILIARNPTLLGKES